MPFARHAVRGAAVAALAACHLAAPAADWSDTYVGWRIGNKFAEPFNPDDIRKHVVNVGHVSGYTYGTNFFNVDLLLSDDKDPAGAGSTDGAQEAYLLYRHTLDLEKVSGRPFKLGPVRGLGLTAGFDLNTKNDAGYNSKKRMLVAGPTVFLDVPAGFVNVSLLALWESNAPYNTFTNTATPRYRYDTHPMLNVVWAIPFGLGLPASFEGYANFIGAKGKDEFGGDTKPETNIDMQLMFDLSGPLGAAKNRFRVGIEYQYWRNKFGNDHKGPAGRGAFAKTPMIRAEYHF